MGPSWAHLGSLSDPLWISDGSILDSSGNHIGSPLDPSWILDGPPRPISEPNWFFSDPSWILDGSNLDPSWNPFGSPADPSGIIHGSNLDPTWNHLGSFVELSRGHPSALFVPTDGPKQEWLGPTAGPFFVPTDGPKQEWLGPSVGSFSSPRTVSRRGVRDHPWALFRPHGRTQIDPYWNPNGFYWDPS